VTPTAKTLRSVEQFLYREAALLDGWDLDGWLSLFTTPCAYQVTPTGEDDPASLSPQTSYFLIADDRERLEARITRMKSPSAHVESPRSRTRHMYSNVRVTDETSDGLVAWANFLTFRNRNRQTTNYMGCVRFELARVGDELKIRSKRVMLDLDALIPQGKVSIFL
jgi:p-cumate 2,3-dioxygenase subunit beta